VAPFVDQLLAVDTPDNQRKFLSALGWIDGEAQARYHHSVEGADRRPADELLTAVSTAEPAEPPHFWVRGEAVIVPAASSEAPATTRDRFDELKGWIAGAYYSSEIGMRELGWTGQAFFSSFPGCEHPGGHRTSDRALSARPPPTAAPRVASSAGKKHSMRSSCSVTSCGVPNVVMVENTLRRRSPLR
jgi:hypothetical protein